MAKDTLCEILKEIRGEYQLCALEDEILLKKIKEAEYNINSSSGAIIDYEKDLDAKSLLKNYVFYDAYNRLAEFKQLYGGEYASLQIKYYKDANLS